MANPTNGKENIKPSETSVKKKKKKPVLKYLKIFFITLFSVIILVSVAGLGVVLAMIKTCPSLDVDGTILNLDEPSVLYDDSNQVMDTVITSQKRTVVKMNTIPANLANAFVSIEDERFYQHGGIDVKRIISASFQDLLSKIHKTGNIQGASTITQELIKQRMFLDDSLTNRIDFKRKVQEAYLATELEKVLTKNQILEAFMNTIYLGGQANGVEAAANQYFSKDVKDLNLVQCAFIAGLTQSPSKYYPFSPSTQKNPSIYINRTKTVLSKMLENNYISQADYNSAVTGLSVNSFGFAANTTSIDKYNYLWFSSYAVSQVKADLKAKYNYTDEQVNNLISNGGLKIYTSMSRSLEESSQKIINADSSYKGMYTSSWADKSGTIQPEASATLIDYHTGLIKVIIGGRGNQPTGSWNRAVTVNDAKPVGSSIKPLTVYSPAIESKIVTAGTTIKNTDVDLDPTFNSKYPNYNPQNDDPAFDDQPVTIRNAITASINKVAVKVEDKLGLSTGATYAEKYGLKLTNADKSSIAALSLGQINGSNSLTMAAAYGTFGNNGLYTTPRAYTKVVDDKGTTILESSTNTRQVISAQTAYIMYDMLKGPINDSSDYATGTNANLGDMPAAGKTGTTSNMMNLWFCGLTSYYSAAVWMGDDEQNPTSLNELGANSNTTANVWRLIMTEATKGLAVKDIDRPDGIINATIDKDSGLLPTQGCYDAKTTYSEMFLDGTVPTATSTLHPSKAVTNTTNTTTNNSTITNNTASIANKAASDAAAKRAADDAATKKAADDAAAKKAASDAATKKAADDAAKKAADDAAAKKAAADAAAAAAATNNQNNSPK